VILTRIKSSLMMISWWSKHVGAILSVLMCDIWINVLLQTIALVGPKHIVNWNERWNSKKKRVSFNSIGCCEAQTYLRCTEVLCTSDTMLESSCVEPREARGWLCSILIFRRVIPVVYSIVCCWFSWRYNPLWLYFSLLVFEVSWSHTTTRHSR
jgi:hypothetical protein